MVKRSLLFACCMLLPAAARAADLAQKPAQAPVTEETRVHHAPVAATDEDKPLTIQAHIERPDRAKRVLLVYASGPGGVREVAFERTQEDGPDAFAAEIPASDVHAPRLAYAIEVEDRSGARHDAFASRAAMHDVEVLEDEDDLRERAQLDRLDHRRSQLTASTEYAYFGTTTTTVGGTPFSVRDEFWRVDASYTYRILRTVAEFGISFGVVRGSSLVPNATTPDAFDVGLNYGAPRIRFRATDWLHFDVELLTSITEVGFSVGAGGAVLLGSPYAMHVTLGGEGIENFGGRGYARLDIPAGRRVTVAPTVEVTNMPHATDAGVRLLLDTSILLGHGFSLGLRGGYMARTFASGGFGGGAQVGFAF
jgi:hypothetical protein